jgi:hypothetical protein
MLGVSVQPAHPRTPTDMGVIERTFESINTLFCQHVAGYTGREVTRRGADLAERAVCSVADSCRTCWMSGSSPGGRPARTRSGAG